LTAVWAFAKRSSTAKDTNSGRAPMFLTNVRRLAMKFGVIKILLPGALSLFFRESS